tara:strand:+ start:432 stop:863 length:432 start_codon:yes stop_codon:yes gene_type:complete
MTIKKSALQIFQNEKGLVRKVLDKNDENFYGFGEAYITEINFNKIKGWKKHKNKINNFIVVYGSVQFVAWYPNKPKLFQTFILEASNNFNNYSRLSLGENIWFAFRGLNSPLSRILNISNICNEEVISEELDLDYVNYDWYTN